MAGLKVFVETPAPENTPPEGVALKVIGEAETHIAAGGITKETAGV